jgi:hypothetical protein
MRLIVLLLALVTSYSANAGALAEQFSLGFGSVAWHTPLAQVVTFHPEGDHLRGGPRREAIQHSESGAAVRAPPQPDAGRVWIRPRLGSHAPGSDLFSVRVAGEAFGNADLILRSISKDGGQGYLDELLLVG